MKKLLTLAVGLFALTCMASAATFNQCLPTGLNLGGCRLLITITGASGGATTTFGVTTTTNPSDNQPYDGIEDTLIGVLNSSGVTVNTLALSSTLNIFGFDGDGPCTQIPGPSNCNVLEPSRYGGPGVTFSGINAARTAGTVNFAGGLANGASAWFGLEEAVTAPNIQGGGTPEPASLLLMGTGICALFVARKRRKA